MRALLVCLTLLGSIVLGCKSDKPKPAPIVPASALGSAVQDERSSSRPEPYANETLPDEADFAAEAEKEITADNFAAKLGELEQELGDAGAGEAGAAGTGSAVASGSATARAKARGSAEPKAKGAAPSSSEQPKNATRP